MTTVSAGGLVCARSGAPVRLGRELARGGEGTVHLLADQRERVVKLYNAPPDPRRVRKLEAMAAQAQDPKLTRIAAWPLDLVRDGGGRVQGFLMPLAGGRKDIHELYSPKSREQAFPEANFPFIVQVAANIVSAFGVVHGRGAGRTGRIVVGDVNEKSVMVAPDATVVLIDCDSFQIQAEGEIFTCDVGVPFYTPPELQGRSLRGCPRVLDHDLFGLAVLLFHLLCMGRHPFSGVYEGGDEMPIERAIREHRYAYGRRSRERFRMRPPPGSVVPGMVGAEIAELFERAFAPEATRVGRPDAARWLEGLKRLRKELVACAADPSHHYHRELGACPWCRLEAATRQRYFGAPLPATGSTQPVDVDALWRPIAAIAAPEEVRAPRLAAIAPVNEDWKIPGRVICAFAAVVGWGLLQTPGAEIAGLVTLGGGVGLWPGAPWLGGGRRQAAARRIDSRIDALVADTELTARRDAFFAERKRLEDVRDQLRGVGELRRRRIADARSRARELQKRRFLDRFRIDRARIGGIGDAKTRQLASFGIETAADITKAKVMRVPGIGEVLADRLLAWRKACEQSFRFDDRAPMDPRDLADIEREVTAERTRLVNELRAGARRLDTLRARAEHRRREVMTEIERAVAERATATRRRPW